MINIIIIIIIIGGKCGKRRRAKVREAEMDGNAQHVLKEALCGEAGPSSPSTLADACWVLRVAPGLIKNQSGQLKSTNKVVKGSAPKAFLVPLKHLSSNKTQSDGSELGQPLRRQFFSRAPSPPLRYPSPDLMRICS